MTIKEQVKQILREAKGETQDPEEVEAEDLDNDQDGDSDEDENTQQGGIQVNPDNAKASTGTQELASLGGGTSSPYGALDQQPVPSFAEDVAALTNGEELTEEFKEKAATIFEAAVLSRVKTETAKIQEAFNAKLAETVESEKEGLVEKVDGYLDYVVEQWMEHNEIALDRGMKTEVMESFFEGLHALFLEHNIFIPDEKFDVLASKESTIETLSKKLDEQMADIVALRGKIALFEAKDVTAELAKGLTETEKAKFEELVEEVKGEDVESFKKKATLIRESYFTNKTPTTKTNLKSPVSDLPVTLVEEKGYDGTPPEMKQLAEILNRIN